MAIINTFSVSTLNIIVVGAGEVGESLCASFSKLGCGVTIVDQDFNLLEDLHSKLGIKAICGDIRDHSILLKAGTARCDFFLAVTNDVSTNLLTASVAKAMGAKNSVARTNLSTTFNQLGCDTFNYRKHFGVNMLVDPDTICAAELAKDIGNPGQISVENIAFSQIEIRRFTVNSRSKYIGRQLKDVNVGSRVRFVLITHNKVAEIPSSDTLILENDEITVAGKHDDISYLLDRLQLQEMQSSVRVTLFGASNVSAALIRYLKAPQYKIRVIEESLDACKRFVAIFPNITVIHGDASSSDLLDEEQIAQGDYFIACSDDDEKNTMVALQARHIGAQKVMLALNDGRYETVLSKIRGKLGITKLVFKRIAAARELANYVSASSSNCNVIEKISNQNICFAEFRVEKHCPLAGLKVKDLGLPKGCVLVSLMRDFNARVPCADDEIAIGDHLVAAMKSEIFDAVKEIFLAGR